MVKDSIIKSIVREVVREELKTVEAGLMAKMDRAFSDFRTEIMLAFREMMNELTTMKLEILGELKTVREEQAILNGRSAKINDIEDKMEKLEKIHPGFTHAAI